MSVSKGNKKLIYCFGLSLLHISISNLQTFVCIFVVAGNIIWTKRTYCPLSNFRFVCYFRLKLNVFHLFYLNTVSAKKKIRKSLILNSFNSWNDVLIKIRYEKQYFCIIFLLLFNAIFDENTESLKSWKSYYILVRQSQ